MPSAVAIRRRRVRASCENASQAAKKPSALHAGDRLHVARLLLPHREPIEDDGDDRRALHDLNEADLAEVPEQHAEHERARRHADEQHRA